MTILEILIAVAILGIMAAAVAPLARMTVQRQKETELRRALRILRAAIDEYHSVCTGNAGIPGAPGVVTGVAGAAAGGGGTNILQEDVEQMCFPPDLETLVEGVELSDGSLTKRKFLRRIPKDPMTNSPEWGLRSYQDEPDSRSWGNENVFDVYSLSEGRALDGTYYRDW